MPKDVEPELLLLDGLCLIRVVPYTTTWVYTYLAACALYGDGNLCAIPMTLEHYYAIPMLCYTTGT